MDCEKNCTFNIWYIFSQFYTIFFQFNKRFKIQRIVKIRDGASVPELVFLSLSICWKNSWHLKGITGKTLDLVFFYQMNKLKIFQFGIRFNTNKNTNNCVTNSNLKLNLKLKFKSKYFKSILCMFLGLLGQFQNNLAKA